MKTVNNIAVGFDDGVKEIALGNIKLTDGRLFFRYTNEFLANGLNISPIHLAFDDSIQVVPTDIFEGLYGVFADSLPDGWGRLLMDRYLMNKGAQLDNITVLNRLAMVGIHGIGALTYRPAYGETYDQSGSDDIDVIYRKSISIYDEASFANLDEMYHLGGSTGGARPKVWLQYDSVNDSLTQLKTDSSEAWIVKFPSSQDVVDIAKIEYIYYLMAIGCGIEMSESKLFEGVSGSKYFGTKRFDRQKGRRLHMISAAGLLHDNYRYTALDYGHLMDAGFRLNHSVKSYEDIFRVAVFNVLALNRDDHSKNFAFLMDNGQWRFAPAYDLTYSTTSHGYQSTSVAGESNDIRLKHFEELASHFGLKSYRVIIDQVVEVVSRFGNYAQALNVNAQITGSIIKNIEKKKELFFKQ